MPEQKALDEIKEVSGISQSVLYNKMPCATWVTKEQAADDIDTYLGGFDEIVSEKKYTPIKRDGKYRIYSQAIGLEEERLSGILPGTWDRSGAIPGRWEQGADL